MINDKKIVFDCYIDEQTKKTIIDELQAVKRKSDVGEKLSIEPKAKVKEWLGHSPDYSDALAYRMLFLITRRE